MGQRTGKMAHFHLWLAEIAREQLEEIDDTNSNAKNLKSIK